MSSAWLGVGGSVLLLPLLPLLTPLDSLQIVQVSLAAIWTVSVLNCLAFWLQKLVLWKWVIRALPVGLFFAFFSGVLVSYLSEFSIRFFLWLFLIMIFFLPLLLKHSVSVYIFIFNTWGLALKKVLEKKETLSLKPGVVKHDEPELLSRIKLKAFYFFSALMGACSGLTGLGGGIILSPFLHESELVSPKYIPAITSWIMFFISSAGILGQISQTDFFYSSEILFVYISLCLPSFLGLFCGYFFNLKQENKQLRKKILRFLVFIMFMKMSFELLSLLGLF